MIFIYGSQVSSLDFPTLYTQFPHYLWFIKAEVFLLNGVSTENTNYGTNYVPLITERDFMSNLQKSKRFDLIEKFSYNSRYLDDIFTILSPELEKLIPDIYPTELQFNKANTSDKETSFLYLSIKVIGSDTSIYDKRDDFSFSIVNFPGWVVIFVDSDLTVFTFRSCFDSLGAVPAFWISILKILKSLQNYLNRVTDITSSGKDLERSLWHTLSVCPSVMK